MGKIYLLFLIVCCFYSATLRAQSESSTTKDFDRVVSRLQDYTESSPQEKIHIHFDKDFYHMGDTVWFKIYLVNALGNRLSSISKIVHINIQPATGKARHMAIPINMGMAAAQLVLTDTVYQAGNYMLKAYTQWMRNVGEEYFFSHILRIGNVLQDKPNAQAITNKSLSLDFFPEGGAMVAGIRSKIGFKAVGNDGLGIAVNGYVVNQKGQQVSLFESMYAGMGVFALQPLAGETYTAVISDGPFKDQRFAIPKVTNDGFVLSVNPSGEDNFQVRISRSASMEAFKEVRLLIQANGEVSQALKLPIHEPSITFTIPKAQMSEGINQITLFSLDNLPLAERLVFVLKKQLGGSLDTDKPEYEARQEVKMKFAVADEKGEGNIGGYSVSVVKTDRATLPKEQQLSIYSNLLLSADLKGQIENPNYYFLSPSTKKASELDALLLTQGWRRFNWIQVLNEKSAVPKYKAEQDLGLRGQITTMGGKPVPNAKISLLVTKQIMMLDTIADVQGRFSFDDLQLSDSAEVILRARGVKEKSNVKIVLDDADMGIPLFNDQGPIAIVLDSASRKISSPTSIVAQEMEYKERVGQGTTLKTVEIITKRRPPEIKKSAYPAVAPPPDITFEPDKLQEMVNLETHLRGINGITIRGNEVWGRGPNNYFKFEKSKYKDSAMAILLNGFQINNLAGINPRALTGVQIIRGGVIAQNMATALMLPKGSTNYGIVFLTMGKVPDKFIKPNRSPGFLQHSIAGYTYTREFYTPNYEHQKEQPKNDYRSTLFWKPDIITGEDGKAEFSFYTSDETGQYQATLEGIGINGQLYRKISYFMVK